MKKLLSFLGFITLSIYFNTVIACSCAPLDYRLDEAYAETEQVFLGIAIDRRDLDPQTNEDSWNPQQETTFKVVSSFKSNTPHFLKVRSGKIGASCGVTFPLNNGVYLVFAYADQLGQLKTGLCSTGIVHPDYQMVTRTLSKLSDIVY